MGDSYRETLGEPAVSVIIPCRNELHRIEDCISSILSQQTPEGGFEVIIADGMSEDGTRELLKKIEAGNWQSPDKAQRSMHCGIVANAISSTNGEHQGSEQTFISGQVPSPLVRVIDNPGRIASTGLNAAIRVAQGQIVIRVDAHTDYAQDYLRRCVRTLHETGADNVGGPARTKADTYLERAIAAAYHSPFSVGGARFHNVGFEGDVDTVTYGCWRKELFDRVGYFDEELVRNQDDEHNLRIIRKGGRIWQSPSIKSWYRPRGSLSALFAQYMQYGFWKVRVIQKHKIPASIRHLIPGAFVLALLVLFLLSGLSYIASEFSRAHLPLTVGHVSSIALGILISVYFIAVAVASLHTVLRTEWRLFPVLPLVFGCYHLGYGYGFLRGVWNFIIRPRKGRSGFERLTR